MISPCGGVCNIFISPVDCDPPLLCTVHRLQGSEIPESILALLFTAGMYSMCYSSSTRKVERVLNISRSPQHHIHWRQEKLQTCFKFTWVCLQVVSFHLFLHISCKQYSHFSVFVGVKFRKKLLDQINRIPKHIWKRKEKNNNTKAPGALSEMRMSLCQHFLVITAQSTTEADGNLISFSDICFTKIHY